MIELEVKFSPAPVELAIGKIQSLNYSTPAFKKIIVDSI
jgi:hypothetical protein